MTTMDDEAKKTTVQESIETSTHPADEPLVVRKLTPLGVAHYILHGIGVTLGMTLLWSMEAVRNSYFRMLDRMNIKARTRRASAFPPGPASSRNLVHARR